SVMHASRMFRHRSPANRSCKVSAAAMHADEKLDQTMGNQLVQCQKLLVGFSDCLSIGSCGQARSRLQRGSRFANHGIFELFTCNFPKRYESIDRIRKTDGKDTMVARRA